MYQIPDAGRAHVPQLGYAMQPTLTLLAAPVTLTGAVQVPVKLPALAEAQHGVRGGAVPQHRRVLERGQRHRHNHAAWWVHIGFDRDSGSEAAPGLAL